MIIVLAACSGPRAPTPAPTGWAAGITEGHPAVIDAIYFDHVPIVCEISGDLP
jgi:hypothetical protein